MAGYCDKHTPDELGKLPCAHYIEADRGAGFCTLGDKFRCIEAVVADGLQISHSAIQSMGMCNRMFYLRYVVGIEMVPAKLSGPIKMGQLWDAFQDVVYGDADYHGTMRRIIQEYEIPDYLIAKVEGMIRAHEEIGIRASTDDLVTTQAEMKYHHFDPQVGDVFVHGFADRLHKTWFAENKFSSQPQKYTEDIFFICSQVGTYFLCDDNLEHVQMEVARVPNLRQGKSESVDAFEERIYKDVISRPSHYFIGFDRNTKTYGQKYYRGDFEPHFPWLKNRYTSVVREIKWRMENDDWYKENTNCFQYGGACDYKPICEYGMGWASEKMYRQRRKPEQSSTQSEQS